MFNSLNKKLLLLFFAFLFFSIVNYADAAWYSGSYSYRKAIVIDSAQVDATLTDFPVLINLSDSDLASKALSTGADIVFTSSNGTTKLAHEIEEYTSSNGELWAWVKVPSLSSSADTTIYMYYGGPPGEEDPAEVWTNGYAGVWHLKEDGNTTAGGYPDSTSNSNDGTGVSMTSSSDVTGQISRGQNFDGSADYIDLGSSSPFRQTSAITYSYWTNIPTGSSGGHVMGTAVSGGHGSGGMNNTTGTINFSWTPADPGSDRNYSASVSLSNDNWYYVVNTIDFSGSTSGSIYLNGQDQSATISVDDVVDGIPQTSYNTANGDSFGSRFINSRLYYGGSLDEIRISGVTRTSGWISTEYNNQSATSTFYTVNSEEARDSSVKIRFRSFYLQDTNWYSSSYKYRKEIEINPNYVGSTLTDFPVMVKLDDSDISAGAREDGSDIVFTSSDGITKLAHEIEGYSDGSLNQVETFTTSGTWVAPAGVTSVTVEAWGGGGGGQNGGAHPGAGGGGGAYARKEVSVTPGNSYTVTIGAGGGEAQDGGDSWFSSTGTVLADGGYFTSGSSGSKGAGGLASASVGDVTYSGGSGGARPGAGTNPGGGGGGSATASGAGGGGGNGSSCTGGAGGSGEGNGGKGGDCNQAGTNGSAPGGGGGGRGSGWFASGSGANGRIKLTYQSAGLSPVAWVKVPSVSSSATTTLYVYYGGPPGEENPTEVWTNGYVGVYHLNEDVNTTSGGYNDSSPKNNNMTGVSMTLPSVVGQMGSAQDFDGGADYINSNTVPTTATTNVTISAWVKPDTSSQIAGLVMVGDDNGTSGFDGYTMTMHDGSGSAGTDVGGVANGLAWLNAGTGDTLTSGSWNYVIMSRDSSTWTFYRDGSPTTGAPTTNPIAPADYLRIGSQTGQRFFNGKIDEVRVSTVQRSADWISAEYDNQSSPDNFYWFGSQEARSTGDFVRLRRVYLLR